MNSSLARTLWHLWLQLWAFVVAFNVESAWCQNSAPATTPMFKVQHRDSATSASLESVGHIVVEAQDGGLLLELQNGKYKTIKSDEVEKKTSLDRSFVRFNSDEHAKDLLSEVPPGFEVYQTDHYLICSNSAEEYAEFCGKLQERVYDQYFAFMKDHGVEVYEPSEKLPVIILQSASEFQEFAEARNPGRTFQDSPGYYSIVDNQTLLVDLTRDRSVRAVSEIRKQLAEQPLQVATMVHESVHQLAFNSGLQVRFADNPVWLSEGLAVFFEPITPRSSTLWTKPGLVNGRLHPIFVNSVSNGRVSISLDSLIGEDDAFLKAESAPASYAESWALVSYLFKEHPAGMKAYLAAIAGHQPLKQMSREERIQEFSQAIGKSPGELESAAVSFVQRMRIPR